MLSVTSLAVLTAEWISSLVIRPDGPVPEIIEMSTASSRASFLVAGEALTLGATEMKLFLSSEEVSVSSSSTLSIFLLVFSVEVF